MAFRGNRVVIIGNVGIWLYLIYTWLSVASSLNIVLIFSEYRCGFCYLELENIPAGIYNIIPSTFLPKQEGPFFLDFNSIIPIKTTQLQWWRNLNNDWILCLPNINSSNEDTKLQDTTHNNQNTIRSLKTLQWHLVLKSWCLVRTVYSQNSPKSFRSTIYMVLCIYGVGLHLGAILYIKD